MCTTIGRKKNFFIGYRRGKECRRRSAVAAVVESFSHPF